MAGKKRYSAAWLTFFFFTLVLMGNGQALSNQPRHGQDWRSPSTGMEFAWIEALGLWVGKYEVTNGEYRQKELAHDSQIREGHSLDGDRQPVVFVNFDDAKAYARWLTDRDRTQGRISVGYEYRLPMGSEWLIFAQCGDGRDYPWGNEWPPPTGHAGNYSDGASAWYYKIDGYRDGFPVSCDVGVSWKNSWGLFGVGGNVWEMTTKTVGGEFDAWRGASYDGNQRDHLSCTFKARYDSNNRGNDLGFRLVFSSGDYSAEVFAGSVDEVDGKSQDGDIDPRIKNDNTSPATRIWMDAQGDGFEAEFVSEIGHDVVFRGPDGRIVKVPFDALSKKDQDFIAQNRPLNLGIDVGKSDKGGQGSFYETFFARESSTYYTTDTSSRYKKYYFRVKVDNKSRYEIARPLDMHLFIFSRDRRLVRHELERGIRFSEDGKRYEYGSQPVSFREHRTADDSQKYGGFLVLITNKDGKVESMRSTSSTYEKEIERLLEYAGSKKGSTASMIRELQPVGSAR